MNNGEMDKEGKPIEAFSNFALVQKNCDQLKNVADQIQSSFQKLSLKNANDDSSAGGEGDGKDVQRRDKLLQQVNLAEKLVGNLKDKLTQLDVSGADSGNAASGSGGSGDNDDSGQNQVSGSRASEDEDKSSSHSSSAEAIPHAGPSGGKCEQKKVDKKQMKKTKKQKAEAGNGVAEKRSGRSQASGSNAVVQDIGLGPEQMKMSEDFVKLATFACLSIATRHNLTAGMSLIDAWKKSKYSFEDRFFANHNFRAGYVDSLYKITANRILSVLNHISTLDEGYKRVLMTAKVVVSVGSGPGADLTGVAAYLRGRVAHTELTNTFMVGFDCYNWGEYFAHGLANHDVHFLQVDVVHNMDQFFSDLTQLQYRTMRYRIDLALISYMADSAALWQVQCLEWWLLLQQKCSAIIILDKNVRDLHGLLANLGFRMHKCKVDNGKREVHILIWHEKIGLPMSHSSSSSTQPQVGGSNSNAVTSSSTAASQSSSNNQQSSAAGTLDGQLLYSLWKRSNYKWDEQLFSHASFQQQYVASNSQTESDRCQSVLEYLSYMKKYSKLLKTSRCFTSFGCGPCADLAGARKFVLTFSQQSINDVMFTGYDIVDWSETANKLLSQPNLVFIKDDVVKPQFISGLPPTTDVVIVSYLAASINLHEKLDWWNQLKNKCALIIVVDKNSKSLNDALEKIGFEKHEITARVSATVHVFKK